MSNLNPNFSHDIADLLISCKEFMFLVLVLKFPLCSNNKVKALPYPQEPKSKGNMKRVEGGPRPRAAPGPLEGRLGPKGARRLPKGRPSTGGSTVLKTNVRILGEVNVRLENDLPPFSSNNDPENQEDAFEDDREEEEVEEEDHEAGPPFMLRSSKSPPQTVPEDLRVQRWVVKLQIWG